MESRRISILTKQLVLGHEVNAFEVEGTDGVLYVHRSVPCVVELNLPELEWMRPWSVTHEPTGALIANVDTQDEAFAFAQELWQALPAATRIHWSRRDMGVVMTEFKSETPPHVTAWVEHVRAHGYVPLAAKQSA